MAIIWGETEEAREAAKRSFEENLEKILIEYGSIRINDLMKRIKHENNLITDYQRVLFGIEELVKKGKIVVDETNAIHFTSLTVLENSGIAEVPIWKILQKEEDVKEKKEIIRKYSEINPLA